MVYSVPYKKVSIYCKYSSLTAQSNIVELFEKMEFPNKLNSPHTNNMCCNTILKAIIICCTLVISLHVSGLAT